VFAFAEGAAAELLKVEAWQMKPLWKDPAP
jgi:hypothetical protein